MLLLNGNPARFRLSQRNVPIDGLGQDQSAACPDGERAVAQLDELPAAARLLKPTANTNSCDWICSDSSEILIIMSTRVPHNTIAGTSRIDTSQVGRLAEHHRSRSQSATLFGRVQWSNGEFQLSSILKYSEGPKPPNEINEGPKDSRVFPGSFQGLSRFAQ